MLLIGIIIVALLFWSFQLQKATRQLQQYDVLAELMLAQFSNGVRRMMLRKSDFYMPPAVRDVPMRRGMML